MKKKLHEQDQTIAARAAAIKRRSFEKTLYILLERLSDTVDEVQYKHIKGIELLYGDRAFQAFIENILPELWVLSDVSGKMIENHVRDEFIRIDQFIGSPFINFLNLLSTLIVFIEDARNIDKNAYFNLLLSQLTEKQLALLSYYGVADTSQKVKKIIEKYGLLRDLKLERLIIDEHIELYDRHAFQTEKKASR